jgi:hypothetical protein
MSKGLIISLFFTLYSAYTIAQSINDEIIEYCRWSEYGFEGQVKGVDTADARFKAIKSSVFCYCNSHWNVKLDTCHMRCQCREYVSFSNSSWDEESKKELALEEKKFKTEGLRYEIYLIIRIKPGISYFTSFVLDSLYHVKETPPYFNKVNIKTLWQLKEWSKMEDSVKRYKNGFILPIQSNYLEYDTTLGRYIYNIEQGVNDKTVVRKKHDIFRKYDYKVNVIKVDAITTKVIYEGRKGCYLTSEPVW